jgi:hypothetical protein
MLRREAMPARHFRHDRARQKGFRNDPFLDVITPAATTSRPDVPPRLRCVNYMVDHICEPICIGWFAFCSSARRRQGGDRRPLTNQTLSSNRKIPEDPSCLHCVCKSIAAFGVKSCRMNI